MAKIRRINIQERGQILPIVVIGVLIIIAMAALILDGGGLLLNRRSAQAAADAGALAGARLLCHDGSDMDVKNEAVHYAVDLNKATSAVATVINKKVNVTATLLQSSFFAKIFNQDQLTSVAEAESGCFPPMGNYLMPVAWSCRPPVTGGVFDELGCKIMSIDWEEELRPLIENEVTTITIDSVVYTKVGTSVVDDATKKIPPPQIYIVMDKISTDTDTMCKEDNPLDPAAIICDLNGDGKMDIEGGGNRGWLDLNNGGGGASDMVNWIEDGLDFPLSPHTWLSGQTGTTTPVYTAMKNYRQGEVVLIPVFNAFCDDSDPIANAVCMSLAHSSPWDPEPPSGDIDSAGQKPKFHIITFEAFYISCVHIKSSDKCPGFTLAQKLNPDPAHPSKSLIPDNVPAVEGFFLRNVKFQLDVNQPCSTNLGNCVVSLTK